MQGIIDYLSGKKTYIVAILLAVYNVGIAFAWWTPDNTYITLVNTILATFGLGFLRAGIAKNGN